MHLSRNCPFSNKTNLHLELPGNCGQKFYGHEDFSDLLKRPMRCPLLIFAVGVECGENRGRTGGEAGRTGGEPGAPKRTGGEPGAFGKRTGGEPGAFGIHLQRVPGEKRGLWDKNRGRTGGEGIFFETRDPTGDLKINEQDRP